MSIFTEVVVRGGVTTTATTAQGLFTDTILRNWVDYAHRWAAAYKPWPFTECRSTTTYTSSQEEWTLLTSYETPFKADSIRLLQIGGERLQKLNFEDYQIFREEHSSDSDRVFSDYARMLFVNPNVDLSGTMTAWGQFQPPAWSDTTDDHPTSGAQSVFSTSEDEGNQAIVEEALSYLKEREKKTEESIRHHEKAINLLEVLWKRMGDEQFGYQSKNRGMFKRIDLVSGSYYDDTSEDQF